MTIYSQHVQLDKWMSTISPQASMQEAASCSLCDRLAYLQQVFPGAANAHSKNADDVHQLRVATRRLLAVLDLYAEWLPTRRTESLRRSLKKIQRAGGNVRDLDVLAKRYRKGEHSNSKQLVKAVGRRRSSMQRRLSKLYRRMEHGDQLLVQAEKLLTKLRASDATKEPASTWMKEQWSKLVEQFYQSADIDIQDLKALHGFRISGKQLRYGLELLAPVFEDEQRALAYGIVEQLQDRLGNLHDHVVAGEMFSDWNKKRNRISKSCDLNQLLEEENQMLEKVRCDFAAWWTSAMKADTRQALEQLGSVSKVAFRSAKETNKSPFAERKTTD